MKTRSGISRTDFADLIGVGYSRIGQLIRQGLPTNADGSIPGDTAARWYCENIRRSVLKSGPGRPGRLKKDVGVTVSEEQRGGRMSGRRVLDRIIESSTRVPEILCEMGVKDPKVILAARDWFIDAVFAFGGQLATDAYDFIREDIPSGKPDYKALARRYGLRFTKVDRAAADELMERFCDIANRTDGTKT